MDFIMRNVIFTALLALTLCVFSDASAQNSNSSSSARPTSPPCDPCTEIKSGDLCIPSGNQKCSDGTCVTNQKNCQCSPKCADCSERCAGGKCEKTGLIRCYGGGIYSTSYCCRDPEKTDCINMIMSEADQIACKKDPKNCNLKPVCRPKGWKYGEG